MKKEEFQKLHGFSDADMIKIEFILKIFKGKITAILNKKT